MKNSFQNFRAVFETYYGRLVSYIRNQASLFKKTSIITISYLVRNLLQLVYFIVIARVLNSTGYGSLGATLALVGVFIPFSSLGSGYLIIKNTASNRSVFPSYWGSAIVLLFLSGSVFTIIVLLLSPVFLPKTIPLTQILCICLADLIFSRLGDIAAQSFQVFDRIKEMMLVQTLIIIFKVIIALFMFSGFIPKDTITFSYYYLFCSVIFSLFSFIYVEKKLGKGIFSLKPLIYEIKNGIFFSIGSSAATIYNDIDKTMLAKFSTLDATGIYTAAYRIIDVTMTPLRAMLTAIYKDFFIAGEKENRKTIEIVKKAFPFSIGSGIIFVIILLIFSSYIPVVLGRDYTDTVLALRFLLPIILIRSIYYILADALTGANYQKQRSYIQVSVAVLNVGLNLLLIPRYSWFGAIYSSLFCEFAMMVCILVLFFRNILNSKKLITI
jgi:O-antigen/teichoic acid export membrane protein